MAEGFANHYGSDVLHAVSSGLAPTHSIALPTVQTMREKNIDISKHVPQHYNPARVGNFDLVINMSGMRLPGTPPRLWEDWVVTDPYRQSPAVYRTVRDDLENRVMRLILLLRRAAR